MSDTPTTSGAAAVRRVRDAVQPPPDQPLSEPFRAGLRPLLEDLTRRIGGPLEGPAVEQVLRLIGDRYTVVVTSDHVRSRGLLRRHTARWETVDVVLLEPMAAMAARRLVARTTTRLAARTIPIPGLRWAAQQVADHVVDRVADPAADLAAQLTERLLPAVVVQVRTQDGEGVLLEGPLALTSLLSRGLTEAVVGEATRRGIDVEVGEG